MNYISVLETLGQPWSKPYDGIKWLTCKANSCNLSIIFFGYQYHAKFCLFNHSHKKWKDCLEGSLYRVLLAAKFEFLKILVPTLSQNTSCEHWMCQTVRIVKKTVFFICD